MGTSPPPPERDSIERFQRNHHRVWEILEWVKKGGSSSVQELTASPCDTTTADCYHPQILEYDIIRASNPCLGYIIQPPERASIERLNTTELKGY